MRVEGVDREEHLRQIHQGLRRGHREGHTPHLPSLSHTPCNAVHLAYASPHALIRFSAVYSLAFQMVVGDPATSQIGSLTSLAHRSKIEFYVDLARQEGGRILCGGRRPTLPAPFDQGAFYLPTIVADLPTTSRCSTEEIFGPVVTVHPFDTEEEALTIANGTRYGLAGSLFTQDVARVQRVTRRWETGMIWVNCWLHRDLRVPFGGVKESGLGSEGGRHSLEFWSNAKEHLLLHGRCSEEQLRGNRDTGLVHAYGRREAGIGEVKTAQKRGPTPNTLTATSANSTE